MVGSSDSESAAEWFKDDPLRTGQKLALSEDPVSERLIAYLRKQASVDLEPP